MRKLAIAASVCLAFIGNISASHAQSAWGAPVTITSYIVEDPRLTLIATGGSNPLHCTPMTNWYSMYDTDPNYSLATSTLLTTYLQKRPVVLCELSCDPDGRVHFRGTQLNG